MSDSLKLRLFAAAVLLAGPSLIMLLLIGGAVIRHFVFLTNEVAVLLAVLLVTGVLASMLWAGARLQRAWRGPWPVHAKEGKYPALLHRDGTVMELDRQHPFPLVTTYSPHIAKQALPEIDAPVEETLPALPTAPALADALPLLDAARGRILFGYDESGPIWLSVEELLSMALAGNTGRGKSKAMLWFTLQLIRQIVSVVILDGKGDLRRWLGAYHAVAYNPGEIRQSVETLLLEAEQRLRSASDDANATFAPVLVVIDELDLVASRCERTIELIELLTKKTRSVNMHGIYSNQSVPADLVGGVATRGVIVSRACFYCDDEAARLIGVRANNGAAALLQQIAPPAPAGLAVARTAVFGWRIVAFPFVPDSAIAWLLQGVPPLPPLPMKPVSLSPQVPQNAPIAPVSEREKERKTIIDLYAQGFKPYVIARKMGRAGAYAEEVKQVIAEEGENNA